MKGKIGIDNNHLIWQIITNDIPKLKKDIQAALVLLDAK